MQKHLEVRCFCSRAPLLAKCGADDKTGELFVHVKSVRGDRINAEAVFTGGTVRILCRNCNRWHTIVIVEPTMKHTQEALPDTIRI